MTTPRGPRVRAGAIALLLLAIAVDAAEARVADERPDVRPADNLALGRPYTFNVWPLPVARRHSGSGGRGFPGYSHVLTDGRFAERDPEYPGAFLFGRSDTGVLFQRAEGVEVVVDLGAVAPISEVLARHSSDGIGSLQPRKELYLVSDDGRVFHPVGEFVNDFDPRTEDDLAAGKRLFRGAKLFRSGPLRTRGRYVMVKTLPASVASSRLAGNKLREGVVAYDEIVVRRGAFDPRDVEIDPRDPYRPDTPELPADVLGYRFTAPSWTETFAEGPLSVGIAPTSFIGDSEYHLSVGGTYLISFRGMLDGVDRVADLRYRIDLPASVKVIHESPHWRSRVSELTRDGKPYRRYRLELAEPAAAFDATSHKQQPFFLVTTEQDRPDPALGDLHYRYGYVAESQRFEAAERTVQLVLDEEIRAPAPERFVQLMYVPRLTYRFPDEARTRLLHFYRQLGFNAIASGHGGDTYEVAKGLGMEVYLASHMCVNGFRFRNANRGWYDSVPATYQFQYHPSRAKRGQRYLPAMCPSVLASDAFFPTLVEEAQRELQHGDHIYVNWEPFRYLKQGCVCDFCKRSFRDFAGLSGAELERLWPDVVLDWQSDLHNRFTSHQHGRVIAALQRATEEAARRLGREEGASYVIATSGEFRAGDERLRIQDPLEYASDVNTIAIWGTAGMDAHAGSPSPTAMVGQNLSDRRHRYVKQLLGPAMQETGSRHAPKLLYLLNPNTNQRLVFPKVFYFHTVLTFLEGWEGHGSFKGVGLDARYMRARAKAARVISSFEDLVWDGSESASFHAKVVSPIPSLRRREGRARILYANSYVLGERRLVALGNDGIDPIFVKLRVGDLEPGGRSLLVDRIHAQVHGGTQGLTAAELRAGVLVRVPPKEFAFLEVRPAGPDPRIAGFERVDPASVRAALDRETPALEARADRLERGQAD